MTIRRTKQAARKPSKAFQRAVDEAQRVAHLNALPPAKRAAVLAEQRARDAEAALAKRQQTQRAAAAEAKRRQLERYGVAPSGTDSRSLDERMDYIGRLIGLSPLTSQRGKFGGLRGSERRRLEEIRAREARQAAAKRGAK